MCRLIGVSSSRSSAPAPFPASHPYYLSWQYNQCFLPMLLNVFLLALIASFSLHCNSKWVWQITTIYLPRYTGFLCRPPPSSPYCLTRAGRHHSRLGNLISQKLASTFGQRGRNKEPGEWGKTLQNKSLWLVKSWGFLYPRKLNWWKRMENQYFKNWVKFWDSIIYLALLLSILRILRIVHYCILNYKRII